jgi:hypothetical protein
VQIRQETLQDRNLGIFCFCYGREVGLKPKPVRQFDEHAVLGLGILAIIILQKVVIHPKEKDRSWL